MKLCKHVQVRMRDGVVQFKGIAHPTYGWSRELQMDVPLIKCTACGEAYKIDGPPVKRMSTKKSRY